MPAPDPFTDPDARREWLRDALRRKRVARDGERITFATISDQAGVGFCPTFADGSIDHTSPHRPGYRFADTNDPDRLDADAAYEERNRRLSNASRHKGEQQDERCDHHAAPRKRTLDELRALAEGAYQDRNVRMQNQWRNR
jgi:hypothetical protein